MSSIVLATKSADLQLRVERATDGMCVTLPLGPLPASPEALFGELGIEVAPDVLVLDAVTDSPGALRLAADFDRDWPGTSVILISELGAQIGLAAMRVGVRDILHPGSNVSDIRPVLERAVTAAQTRTPKPEMTDISIAAGAKSARVISVVSPKGGVGKTTVATNLAVGLARTGHHSTILVDLDLQFGDVASALNLDPDHTLPDALHGPASRDTMVLKTLLTLHETGLYVICGSPSPATADSITTEQVSHLLQMLASEFSYVVVDTAPGLSEHVLAAMDESTDLIFVTSLDVPGVRGLRKELDALTELGMLPDSRSVVLNFTAPRDGLSVADAQATIGSPIDLTLPRSKAAPRSVNQGVPMLQSGVRDPMTKQLRRLVDRFAPAPAKVKRSSRSKNRQPQEVADSVKAPPRRAAGSQPRPQSTVA